MPKQYQFKKYKNCFVLMQLHLMLKIFVCGAWLALWIFFENFVSQKSLEQLCKTTQFTKQRLNNEQIVEKEFFIHIIEICCNSRMLVKSYRNWLLNWQSKGGNVLSDSLPSRVIRFRAMVSFAYSQCTPVRGNDVMANGTRHQQKLQNFCRGI